MVHQASAQIANNNNDKSSSRYKSYNSMLNIGPPHKVAILLHSQQLTEVNVFHISIIWSFKYLYNYKDIINNDRSITEYNYRKGLVDIRFHRNQRFYI